MVAIREVKTAISGNIVCVTKAIEEITKAVANDAAKIAAFDPFVLEAFMIAAVPFLPPFTEYSPYRDRDLILNAPFREPYATMYRLYALFTFQIAVSVCVIVGEVGLVDLIVLDDPRTHM